MGLCSKYQLTEDDIYIFLDFISISQRNERVRQAAIDSLGVFASICHYFCVIAPSTKHKDTKKVCDLVSYSKRGWCRLEQWGHLCTAGTRDMFFYDAKSAAMIHLDSPDLPVPRDCNWVHDSLLVYEGDYTKEDNKNDIVDVVLGLYAMVLKDKEGVTQQLYEMINLKSPRIFPAEYFDNMPELLKKEMNEESSELKTIIHEKTSASGAESTKAFEAHRRASDIERQKTRKALTPRSRSEKEHSSSPVIV